MRSTQPPPVRKAAAQNSGIHLEMPELGLLLLLLPLAASLLQPFGFCLTNSVVRYLERWVAGAL